MFYGARLCAEKSFLSLSCTILPSYFRPCIPLHASASTFPFFVIAVRLYSFVRSSGIECKSAHMHSYSGGFSFKQNSLVSAPYCLVPGVEMVLPMWSLVVAIPADGVEVSPDQGVLHPPALTRIL